MESELAEPVEAPAATVAPAVCSSATAGREAPPAPTQVLAGPAVQAVVRVCWVGVVLVMVVPAATVAPAG